MDALALLADYLSRASAVGAGTLLLVANQPPAARVGGRVQTPFDPRPLLFSDTEAFALAVLDESARHELDTNGSVEAHFRIAGVSGTVTVFFGGGCHNLVFHLGAADGPLSPPRPMTPDGR